MVMVRLGKACAAARKGRLAAARPPNAARRVSMVRSPSNAIPMRNLDHPRAPGKLFDQRVGGGAIVRIEVGIPFVEQVDRRVGVPNDFLKRAELPLAGRIAGLLGVGGLDRIAVLVNLDLV